MKKNSQIHLFLETELKEKLEQQAQEQNISFSELCRQKLKNASKLDKIERVLEEIQKFILQNSNLFKPQSPTNSNTINR